MSKKVELQFNDKGFQNLKKALGKHPYVKVGILSGKDSRNPTENGGTDQELSNATIGLKHEFGSASEGIPPRSFIRMPIEERATQISSNWAKLKNKFSKDLVNGNLKEVMGKLGLLAETAIQDAFTSRGFGKWLPNSIWTILEKGSAKPLIDSGQLRISVTSEVKNA